MRRGLSRSFQVVQLLDADSALANAALAVQAAVAYYSSRDLAGQMQSAMGSRALIEQAKGVLVARERITPDAAFERLVGLSQTANRKLRDIAAELVTEASGAA